MFQPTIQTITSVRDYHQLVKRGEMAMSPVYARYNLFESLQDGVCTDLPREPPFTLPLYLDTGEDENNEILTYYLA